MEIKLNASKLKWLFKPKELVKNFFDFNWGTVLTEIVKIEKDIEGLAFLLLFQTARKTVFELLINYGQEELSNNYNLVSDNLFFENKMKSFFEKEIVLNKDFFVNILEFSPKYMTDSLLIFKEYAEILKIDLPKGINNVYYLSYSANLESEFQVEKERYKKLSEYFDNPMSITKRKYGYLLEFYAEIKNFYTNKLQQNVEESQETLKDLYVEPNFLIFKNNFSGVKNNDKFFKASLGIHKFINDYFLNDVAFPYISKNYNLLFLLGQPGQGKTSFCYKIIHDYLESNLDLPKKPIFFVKIRELVAKDFINNPFEVLTRHFHNNVNFNEDEILLLLDGLDEAYMSGGITDLDLRNLYDRLNKWKSVNNKLKIILTSRENYLNINDPCLDDSLVLKLDVFSDQQVIEYRNKYLSFYPDNQFIKKLDFFVEHKSKIEFSHLNELIRQPVILYFIALANIDVDKSNSRSEIYNKIFNSLAERSWDKQKGQLDFVKKDIKPEVYQRHLREYIRNIAFSIYQSPNLFITLKGLVNLDATKNFISRCFDDEFNRDSKKFSDLTKYLLISFYFQETNKSTDETAVEFFHNSIWEYLTAEYLWEKFKDLFLTKDRNDEFINVDLDDYFDLLNTLTGNKTFGGMVSRNLQEIILNEKSDDLVTLIDRSKKVFKKLSENDFLLRYQRIDCNLTAVEKIDSLFSLSFLYLRFCYKATGRIINLDHKLTKRLLDIYPNGMIHIRDNKYCYMTFSSFDKDFHLISSNLNNVIFEDSISNVSFAHCIFNNVIFEECTLHNIKVDNTKFNKVLFKKVHFYRSGFIVTKCTFKECSFIDARFESRIECENFLKNNKFDKSSVPKIKKKENYFLLNFSSETYEKIYEDIRSKVLEF